MSRTSFAAAEVREMLVAVADRVMASEPVLSEADRNLGDGDHGLGMQRGMAEARRKLESAPPGEAIDKLFAGVGMAMLSSMGGASGVVFGTLFRDGAKAVAGRDSFDAPALAAFLRGACDGVMARGKAKPGDKTMVDALHPAAEAAASATDRPLSEALDDAAAAAAKGVEASKAMIATLGRAKNLGQASVGHPDAGALSVAVIIEAMRDYAAR
jgi:dihydroxyacetone kinase-like protein